jgi:uncharacterized membrane protein YuzA (DUF378 family)
MGQEYRKNKANQKHADELDAQYEMTEGRCLIPVASLLAIGSLIVYLLTLYPSIGPGDAGELTAASCTLGVPHPPGYPLYTLLQYLFIKVLPFQSPAWKANLFSALCSSLSTFFLFLSAARVSSSLWGGILAAGFFAFSPLVWRYSLVSEVFALNTLFLSALIYILIGLEKSKKIGFAFLGAFVLGLSFSHHPTIVPFGILYSVFVIIIIYQTRTPPRHLILKLTALFFLGLTPYLYLPLSSAQHGLATWGDQTTLHGFLVHIFRMEYGSFQLGSLSEGLGRYNLPEKLWLYFSDLFHEFLWIGPILGGLGLVSLWTNPRYKLLGRYTALSFLIYIVVFHGLANLNFSNPLWVQVLPRFWLLPNLLVCLWIGPGFSWLTERVQFLKNKGTSGVLVAAIVLTQIAFNYHQENRSDDLLLKRYATTVLNSIPDRSILMITGDQEYHSVLYMQNCEEIRKDVIVASQGTLFGSWNKKRLNLHFPDVVIPDTHRTTELAQDSFSIQDFIEANQSKFSVYSIPGLLEDGSVKNNFEFVPYGFITKVLPKGTKVAPEAWAKESAAALGLFSPSWFEKPKDVWEKLLADFLYESHSRRAVRLLELDQDLEAAKSYSELISMHPDPPALYYYNLGLAYFRLTGRNEENKEFADNMKVAWNRYLERNPEDKDEAAKVKNVLRSFP